MTPAFERTNLLALITGASSGIGAAIAERLVADGCRVVCAARRMEKLEALCTRLGEAVWRSNSMLPIRTRLTA